MQITAQPESQQAPVGSRVLLTCRASGPPELKYQWFRGKEEVKPLFCFICCCCCFEFQCDLPVLKTQIIGINWLYGSFCPQIWEETGTTPELVLCPLAPTHQGHYICRINHGIKCIFSQWAHVSVISSAGILCRSSFLPLKVTRLVIIYPLLLLSPPDCSSSLLPGPVSGLLITSQPQSQAVSEGDTLFLECKAQGNPPAQYMWHHNKVPMEQEKSRCLQVSSQLGIYNAFI